MKFKIRDKVKIRKNVTLEEISKNPFYSCQSDTMKFLLNASFNNFEETFIVKKIWTDNCVELNNGFLVNTIILDKVEEILDDKEKEYLAYNIENTKNAYKINIEENENFSQISLEEHYKLYEKKGLNKKEIIKQIAKDREVNKNEIYMYFLDK